MTKPSKYNQFVVVDLRPDARLRTWADGFTTYEEAEAFLERQFWAHGQSIPEYLTIRGAGDVQ